MSRSYELSILKCEMSPSPTMYSFSFHVAGRASIQSCRFHPDMAQNAGEMHRKSTQQTEALRAPYRLRIIGTPTPGRVCEPCNRRPFHAVRGHLNKPRRPAASLPLSNFWANSPFVLPKNEILAESDGSIPTSLSNSTFCNRLYCFFNKRWFFDQVLNDFIVRSFLHFGYSVSFEALDKGAIEILGPYGISYTFRRLTSE
uniref:Uncharacterized protein n=1 Tax=Ananas comosus var. bracteatus TaxID=296719 RepID=A0A6V7NSV9_ANACO|nr:unnamed protein product [Ananas comosus var. bracteatus]